MKQNKTLESINSFDELSKQVDLETVKKALKAFETSRLAHKSYYLKRSIVLAKAKAAGITAD